MAAIKTHFKCMICEKVLDFPKNMDIIDFIVLILQFYKEHDICERDSTEVPRAVNLVKRKKKSK